MSVDGFFPWLAQGPFLFFALIIGLVVSIDVAVVEVTRDYDEEKRDGKSRRWTSRMQLMAILHAAFHSVSFLVYMVIIYLLQFIAFLPIDLFDLPEDFGHGLLTLINFIVVAFIWWTYKSKVKEDHSEKSDDSDVVERKDMKVFVNFIRMISHKYGYGDKMRGVAVAGSVAVDMLAVSALLKGVLLPNLGQAPISSWSGCLPLDLLVFAATIFIVVALVVFLAQMLGTVAREFHPLVVLLRVLEPFAVFFILAGVARLVSNLGFVSLPAGYTAYGNWGDAIFAAVMTVTLFWANGIGISRLMKLYAKRSVDSLSTNPPISAKELLSELRGFAPAIWVVLPMFVTVLTCLWFAYSTVPGRETHNHLVEATGYIASFLLLVTVVVLYAPSKMLDDWETSETSNFKTMFRATPTDFFNRLGAVTLALTALSVHTFMVLGQTIESEAIMFWSGYVVLGWLLFDLRRWRFCKSDPDGEGRRTNDADYAEVLTAVGLASSAVAIVVPFIVRQLIE